MYDAPPIQMQRARGRATVSLDAGGLRDLHQSGSAKAFLPRTHTADPEIVYLNTAGGLTGGDEMRFEGSLGAGARATFTTQTAERAYRSAGGPARLDVSLEAGDGAHLDWLPQETILFDGSALERRTEIRLAPDATCLALETLVLGRAAMGETVRSLDLDDRRRVLRGGRPLVIDPVRLTTGRLADTTPGGLRGARAFLSLVYVAPDAEDRLAPVRARLGRPGLTAAASAWDGRLAIRAMGPDARAIRRLAADLVIHLRGRPLPRVWQV